MHTEEFLNIIFNYFKNNKNIEKFTSYFLNLYYDEIVHVNLEFDSSIIQSQIFEIFNIVQLKKNDKINYTAFHKDEYDKFITSISYAYLMIDYLTIETL